MARISDTDMYCCEIRWFALDKNGYVYCCLTAGNPNIPEFVCKDDDETNFLNRFFLFNFDKEKNSPTYHATLSDQFIEELKLDDFIDEYEIILALKGIVAYDHIIEYCDEKGQKEFKEHPYCYKKVTQPTELLHFDQLPENDQKMMDSHRMNNVDVTKTDYFFVPANPNY